MEELFELARSSHVGDGRRGFRSEAPQDGAHTSQPSVPSALNSELPPLERIWRRVSTPGSWRRRVALGGAAVVATLGLVVLLVPSPSESDAAEVSATAPKPPTPPAAVQPCRQATPPRELADAVNLSVPITIDATLDEDSRVLIGFASTATQAAGLSVDLSTLDAAEAFEESGTDRLSTVAPTTAAPRGFLTSRQTGTESGAGILVVGGAPAEISSSPGGFVVRQRGEQRLLWPGASDSETTTPSGASLPGGGAVLALRSGGRDGSVMVGRLDGRGQAVGQLSKVNAKAVEYGTPSVAVGERRILVSFAARKKKDGPWRVELADAPLGEVPTASRTFSIDGMDPGANAISPSATALPNGGWLLQWTEGERGKKYRVRVQTLDEALAPIGKTIEVAPEAATAGQGTIWAKGGHALSTYIVRPSSGGNSGQSQLWATALSCGR